MKRILLVALFFGLLSILFFTSSVLGQSGIETLEADDYFGLPLCLPGMPADGTCWLYGPAQSVAEMRQAGFPYPARDLPAAPVSADLGEMPVLVAKINLPENEPAPIFGSFEDAVAQNNPVSQVAPGSLRFITYVTRLDHEGNAYVQLATGGWLRASPAAVTDFQGLRFFANPHNDFGWIVDQTKSYLEPSFSSRESDNTYYREDIIQVYQAVEAEGLTWYQIAPNEWVNSSKARIVSLNTTPPEGLPAARWIEINLLQQTLMVYEEGHLLFATLVATGLEPFYTQPGIFQVYQKKPLETMQGAFEADRSDYYYLQDVPWTMYFDQARALHAAYWRTYFGYPQSHGCVNLSPGDANWLFQWASEGDFVWVHDPSGKTPTDEDYYGPGAP